MKKILAPLAAAMLLAAAPAAFAEWELGVSETPITYMTVDSSAMATQLVPGFHVGYGWFILYASWDSIAMPSWFVEQYTHDASLSVPGFLNLYDVGLRFLFKPVELYATVGTNSIHAYEHPLDLSLGANIRLGAGLKFRWWGVSVSGTNVYGSWADLTAVVTGLTQPSTRAWAEQQILYGLVPSVNLTFYF